MTDDPTFFTQPEIGPVADHIYIKPNLRLWTDDYSSLLPILQPRRPLDRLRAATSLSLSF